MDVRLDGKRVVVTGGGSGIGAATVLEMSRSGASVVALDRDATGLAHVADMVRALGGEVDTAVCDVSDPDAAERTFAEILSAGPVHVLVNNAGVGGLGTVDTIDRSEWRRVLSVNVDGAYHCSRQVVPAMMRLGGGAIINVASVAGILASAGRIAYSTSKGAVITFTQALALDHAPVIRCNAVCPGVIRTNMTKISLANPQVLAQKVMGTPLGRVGEPSEVAAMITFLASDHAAFITGQAIAVDGGWTIAKTATFGRDESQLVHGRGGL